MTPSVLFVDDDADLRDMMVLTVETSLHAKCLALASLGDMEKRSDEVLRCSVALLDLNLGPEQPSGLDAHAWLLNHSFPGRILFLTGYGGSDPLVQKARGRGVEVLEKPIPIEELTAVLEKGMAHDGAACGGGP